MEYAMFLLTLPASKIKAIKRGIRILCSVGYSTEDATKSVLDAMMVQLMQGSIRQRHYPTTVSR